MANLPKESCAVYPDGTLVRNCIVGHPRYNRVGTIVRRMPYTFASPGYDVDYDGTIIPESFFNLELAMSIPWTIDGIPMTVQLQRRNCGVRTCKRCHIPTMPPLRGHGPYWYGYYMDNGKRVNKYIGALLPAMER